MKHLEELEGLPSEAIQEKVGKNAKQDFGIISLDKVMETTAVD